MTVLFMFFASFYLSASELSSYNQALSLVEKINKLYYKDSSHAVMKLSITRPKFKQELNMEWFSNGLYNVFLKVMSPGVQAEKKILKIGKVLFFYEPEQDRVIQISQTGSLRRFLLSEFSRDDFMSLNRLSEEYYISLADTGSQWKITLRPKIKTVIVWDKIVYKVDKKSELPVRKTYFNEKGQIAKELHYKSHKDFNGFYLPSVLEMKSHTHPGYVSRLEYLSIDFNTPILPHLFTKKNLQNLIDYKPQIQSASEN